MDRQSGNEEQNSLVEEEEASLTQRERECDK